MSDAPFLYPNVTSIPGQTGVETGVGPTRDRKREPGVDGEFDQVLKDLNYIKTPLKFSAHATQRLKDRKIELDSTMMAKVNDAIDRAEAKGIEDGLILTQDAALIVNIKNRTIITALDRASMAGNVFTNIDGAVIV